MVACRSLAIKPTALTVRFLASVLLCSWISRNQLVLRACYLLCVSCVHTHVFHGELLPHQGVGLGQIGLEVKERLEGRAPGARGRGGDSGSCNERSHGKGKMCMSRKPSRLPVGLPCGLALRRWTWWGSGWRPGTAQRRQSRRSWGLGCNRVNDVNGVKCILG